MTCLAQDTESEQTEKQNSVLAVVSRHYKLTLVNVRKYTSLEGTFVGIMTIADKPYYDQLSNCFQGIARIPADSWNGFDRPPFTSQDHWIYVEKL